TDEFREVLYLDYVKLVAVDHPPEIEVHPTDKLMPSPFPPSEVWGLARPARLRSVVGDDGMDRTEAVRAIDGLFAPPGEPLPSPYRGMCHPLTLTMDFGPLDPQAPLVLALTGWLQYGDASTNIALSQDRSLTIIPPTIEVEVAPGDWRGIDVVVGMPAGKTKTILCDLDGKLPTGAARLRLSTTFEIRWDRIALFERVGLEDSRIRELSAVKTDLHWRGFSDLRARAAHHPSTPDYAAVSPTPPWRTTLEGWCTVYGDVTDLVTRRDNRLAILNAGDALTIEFDWTDLPPIPHGHDRTFFLYSVGWDKDGDHNVVGGTRVGPLPRDESIDIAKDAQDAEATKDTDADPDDHWRIRYNTRWVPADRFRPENGSD
ncbi:MAG: hypothetical protein IID36_12265, partial [Planctomycetes bacterium]|nr:hypothetical protein [Planctomycetota bacterium]